MRRNRLPRLGLAGSEVTPVQHGGVGGEIGFGIVSHGRGSRCSDPAISERSPSRFETVCGVPNWLRCEFEFGFFVTVDTYPDDVAIAL